jgi:uncharacterized delta-60 repeat protein
MALAGAKSVLAEDGSLDFRFGNGGRVTTDFGSTDFSSAVVLQLDGNMILAGSAHNSNDMDFALVAYQPDGKVLMTGESSISGNISDFGVARYSADGSLDNTFGTNGIVITDIGSLDHGAAILLQPDSKIVVAGYSWSGNNYDFALVRYNTDGSLDL